MTMIPEHLPVIDWELSLKLANNNRELAKDMLKLIAERLPDDLAQINTIHNEQNIPQLIHHIHKLHGALCYCGLPRIKFLVTQLETDLKNNIMENSPPLLDQLNSEVTLLASAMAAEPHQLTSSSDKNE